MNNRWPFTPGFWLIEVLVAAAVIFWAFNAWRSRPDGAVARLLHHRDRVWFALLLLFVPVIVLRFLVYHLFLSHLTRGPGPAPEIAGVVFAVFDGAVYGLAGCWFASPAKKAERFSYATAFMVAVALFILISGIYLAIGSFRIAPSVDMSEMMAGLAILAFLASRLFIRKKPGMQEENEPAGGPVKPEPDPAFAFTWLLVGLVPIPILLVFASSNPPNPTYAPYVLVGCAICNLCGGLGCLGRLKNIGVRIILGILLGVFFFLLSWIVALFEACSHSGGI
jgi:hypothetical protein